VCRRAAAACNQVLSLPLHPALDDDDIAAVASAVQEFGG
jgi:dTDP-4-amino-4,6-dideoxygalactose transaminase